MHIILGLLGTIVTILVLLNRLAEAGIDPRSLNPFHWYRRRKWRQLCSGNQLYNTNTPMDSAGILIVGVAKADGDICIEEKQMIKELFTSEFNLTEKDAAALFVSSSFLIGDGIELRSNVTRFLAPTKDQFNESQIKSTLALMDKVATIGGEVHPNVREFVAAVGKEFNQPVVSSNGW